MNINDDKEHLIFRKDGTYGAMYSTGLSKKLQDGNYENGFIRVQFKKGIELEDKTKIKIKNGWLSFYKTKSKETTHYIFINEFEKIIDKEQEDPFKEFGSEHKTETDELTLTEEDLPF